MGEIHYTRIPNEQWEEQILKVKSGGVNVICTYVFWNIHEETEGVFDWDGYKDLLKFISLCQKQSQHKADLHISNIPGHWYESGTDAHKANPAYPHF